jgi:pyrophosphatase PpaX
VFVIKAIIFDFDGTLANTLPICFLAFKKVFKEFDDKDYSSEEIKAMFGPSETGIIRENLSYINKEQAIELYYKAYTEHHQELVKPNDEMDELLGTLKSRGIKLGVVTGKGKRSLDISLKALQMDGLFDVIITGDDVMNPKPHPEGVIKALKLLGIEKEDAMFLGDSDADIQAGKQANVYTVGVQWLPDFHSSKFNVEPDLIFTSIREFNKAVKIGVMI